MAYPRHGANIAFESMIQVFTLECLRWDNNADYDAFFDMKLDPETDTYYWTAVINDTFQGSGDDEIFMRHQYAKLEDVTNAVGAEAAVEALETFIAESITAPLVFKREIDKFHERIHEADREGIECRFVRDGGTVTLRNGSL